MTPEELSLYFSSDIMQQFDHPHIIHLIGICSVDSPIWIVMEVAPLGEVRDPGQESCPMVSESQDHWSCHQNVVLKYMWL